MVLSLPVVTTNVQTPPIPEPLGGQGGSIDGLYLHIPFCFHKCHYCDFYSVVDHDTPSVSSDPSIHNRHAQFVTRLIHELQQRSEQLTVRPRTIFVGGGTPTLLSPHLWETLLAALHRIFDWHRVEEFTVEANPETITDGLMQVLVGGGVNRMSMGAQSFDEGLLKTLERWHEPAKVVNAVRAAQKAGITNVNLDLIFGIPGQTSQQLTADIDAALAIEPNHISYYGLTYEPNTALTGRLRMGHVTPVDETIEQQMMCAIMDRLEAAGLEHYEISSWAKPSQQCQHNQVYWCNENWLGIGPSAASHIDGHRWKNESHLNRYLSHASGPLIVEHEHLPPPRRVGEHLMLRLRLRDGVPRKWLNHALSPNDPRQSTITELHELGMLEWSNEHLRLTRRGMLVADTVMAKLL